MLQTVNDTKMLDEKWYSLGRKSVQVVLPAASTLYFTLGNIWGFPAIEQVVGTLAAVATFIGVCLGLSTRQYNASGAAYDGAIEVFEAQDGKKTFSLNLDGDPEEIVNKDSVTFKVPPVLQTPVGPQPPNQ
jgi:hypothetical protein